VDFVDRTFPTLADPVTRGALLDQTALKELVASGYDVASLPVTGPYVAGFDEVELGPDLSAAAAVTGSWVRTDVTPGADYTYDAVYRLVTAQGREHIGQTTAPQPTWDDAARTCLPQPGPDRQGSRRQQV
jgi:hypothetical protein